MKPEGMKQTGGKKEKQTACMLWKTKSEILRNETK
jgi:hypothetical protein